MARWRPTPLLSLTFFVLIFMPVMCTAIGPLMVPSVGRVAAPVACPSGYERSYVHTWATGDGMGHSSEHWELVCVSSGGAETRPSDFSSGFTLLAFFVLVWIVPVVPTALLVRRSLRRFWRGIPWKPNDTGRG